MDVVDVVDAVGLASTYVGLLCLHAAGWWTVTGGVGWGGGMKTPASGWMCVSRLSMVRGCLRKGYIEEEEKKKSHLRCRYRLQVTCIHSQSAAWPYIPSYKCISYPTCNLQPPAYLHTYISTYLYLHLLYAPVRRRETG